MDSAYERVDPKHSFWGLYTGFQIFPFSSLELGYKDSGNINAVYSKVKVRVRSIESKISHDWYLEDNLSAYGKLGISFWDFEKKWGIGAKNASGISPLVEVGFKYNVNSNLDLLVGYQYTYSIGNSTTGEYNNNELFFGLYYNFN